MDRKPQIVLSAAFILLFLLPWNASSREKCYRVMFYNVENLFDTEDDPSTDDNEFLPESIRRWNKSRLRKKLDNLSKTIVSLGQEHIPSIIGLCEVENDSVLYDLTRRSPLRNLDYEYITATTSDPRGIRNALLYQPQMFKLLTAISHPVALSRKTSKRGTRDILHAQFVGRSGDTLHVVVCHYPSRSGGEQQTMGDRITCSKRLLQITDSLTRIHSNLKLLAMGDFNDNPSDPSIKMLFPTLRNLAPTNLKGAVKGSYKYQGEWSLFDQMLCTPSLFNPDTQGVTIKEGMVIFAPDHLLQSDTGYEGVRPFRTYHGMKYHGGFSDHLPCYVDIIEKR